MKHDAVLTFLNYVRRKDPIGGSVSTPEYNQIAERAVFEFFRKIMGLPSQYQKGARDPVIGKGLNDVSEEKLRPLKVLPTALTIDSSGYADYPEDYFRHGPCGYVYTAGIITRNIEVVFVNDNKLKERAVTHLDPPSLTDPVANLHADKIRFLPVSLAGVAMKLEYIKFPTTPVMGYVIDINTAENIYVNKGAYVEILTPGAAGDGITLTVGTVTLGAYTTISGDTAEDFMIGLTAAVNVDTLSHNVKAVYDGERIVLIDLGETYTVLTATTSGAVTRNKSDFTTWSTQFDWENDNEAMNDIVDIMLNIMGISNRDIPITQWAENEKQK
jgi:hypothetical protein